MSSPSAPPSLMPRYAPEQPSALLRAPEIDRSRRPPHGSHRRWDGVMRTRRLAAGAAFLMPFVIPSVAASASSGTACCSTEPSQQARTSSAIDEVRRDAETAIPIAGQTAELEQLTGLYERATTELAGITLDLRRRLNGDLLDCVAAVCRPSDAAERITDTLQAHVAELERIAATLNQGGTETS